VARQWRGSVTLGIKVSGGAAFIEGLRRTPRWVNAAADEVADGFLELVDDGFDRSRSPSGRRWAPLVLRNGKPLDDSGELRNSWTVEARAKLSKGLITFALISDSDYASYHQTGTGLYGPRKQRIYPKAAASLYIPGYGYFASVRGAPARKMVPDNDLPPRWRRLYERTFESAFEDNLT
jgi:phage gpG-like protein